MARGKKGKMERVAEKRLELVVEKIRENGINVNDISFDRLIGQLQNPKIKPKVIAFILGGVDPQIVYDLRRIVLPN